jgi:ABC-type Zn uptake system ZnuABC Zn-binding protein ZnuA
LEGIYEYIINRASENKMAYMENAQKYTKAIEGLQKYVKDKFENAQINIVSHIIVVPSLGLLDFIIKREL